MDEEERYGAFAHLGSLQFIAEAIGGLAPDATAVDVHKRVARVAREHREMRAQLEWLLSRQNTARELLCDIDRSDDD
jgi:hypothetical protein